MKEISNRLSLKDSTDLEYFSQAIYCPLGCPPSQALLEARDQLSLVQQLKMLILDNSLEGFDAQTKLPRINLKRCKINLDTGRRLGARVKVNLISMRPCFVGDRGLRTLQGFRRSGIKARGDSPGFGCAVDKRSPLQTHFQHLSQLEDFNLI